MAEMGGTERQDQSRPFATIAAGLTFVLFELTVFTQGWLAHRDHFLTPTEMTSHGISAGLPFLCHLGMWGDVLIISPLAAYIVGRFSPSWRWRDIAGSLAAGVAVSIVMGWSYSHGSLPEAHVQNHHLTPAGWLHQAYMALAIAIFFQFFIFATNVTKSLLWVTSLLLVVHVLLGTHMVLGLYNIYFPLGWYPAQPLRSSQGWYVVLGVAAILFFRCIGLKGLILTYVFLTMEDPTTSEGYLKVLNRVCDLTISATLIFRWFFSDLENGIGGLQLILFLMIATKYFLSRTSAKQELEIGKALYPPGNVPDVLKPKSRVMITVLVGIFLIAYWLLGFFYNEILIASLILTALACNDMHTRFNVSDILDTFEQPEYMPDTSTSSGRKIIERRKIARWYLEEVGPGHSRFFTWTSAKEAFSVVGSAIPFGLALFGYFTKQSFDFAAYSILISTQVINEIITMWWRIGRFRHLLKIDTQKQLVAAGQQ
jgi:hypothetical protein